MFSEDGLSTVGTIMSFIKTVVEQVRNAAALTDNTTKSEGPSMGCVSSFVINNSLNGLFAALASNIDGLIINFRIGSKM
jgi:hypothetical protein